MAPRKQMEEKMLMEWIEKEWIGILRISLGWMGFIFRWKDNVDRIQKSICGSGFLLY